ncbi:hypothetical protein [Candidatus Formimonas warabiya]|uniref:Uncharacterized protein n=1 Tax=Formimonas warabiya TaxID=1761012 RepID=A0A3G1KR30_FORW1|nr:hypothetical protein [Candidatus Formimonas warabiya]ATW24900.1 hypothetical protein DCMF_09065 [Candidatus Formimonas warabiya]
MQEAGREEEKDFLLNLKALNPDRPIFPEKAKKGLSRDLKNCLEDIFDVYLEKRQLIKKMLEELYPDRRIRCEQAHRMAEKLGVSGSLVANVCDEYGYRITHCTLCCF